MTRKASAEDELTLRWVKSSYSDSSNSNECVEVGSTPNLVHVRDSKHTTGPRLTFPPATWTTFLDHVSTAERAQTR
jgi:hypothetical protein